MKPLTMNKLTTKIFLAAFIMSLALFLFSGCSKSVIVIEDATSKADHDTIVARLEAKIFVLKNANKCFKYSYDVFKVVPNANGVDVLLIAFEVVCASTGKPCILALRNYANDYAYIKVVNGAADHVKCPTTISEFEALTEERN